MPSLDDLKSTWFINFPESMPPLFPPSDRYPGCAISRCTDGNRVQLLLDGSAYMAEWYQSLENLGDSTGTALIAGWQLQNVPLLGRSRMDTAAHDRLEQAHRRGVRLFILVSDHLVSSSGALIDRSANQDDICQLQNRHISTAVLDARFPAVGSAHQKFAVFYTPTDARALVGVDISNWRWDRPDHSTTDPDRTASGPTHDVGILVRGPAVAEIAQSFRDRWRDPWITNVKPSALTLVRCGLNILSGPSDSERTLPTLPSSPPVAGGTHSVQILHTYGRPSLRAHGYAWSNVGEFSIWRAYVNAISHSRHYIYIEDQYFFPFGTPPHFNRPTGGGGRDALRDSDIIYQLGEAIQRDVVVVVVTPGVSEDGTTAPHQAYQKLAGIRYLQAIAQNQRASGGQGDLIIANPPYFIHAKLMICDDQFALIGSANICRRSMSHDSELHVGIIDSNDQFTRNLRQTLWQHHTNLDSPEDWSAAVQVLRTARDTGNARFRPFNVPPHGPEPSLHEYWMDHLVDPYAGPDPN
jgi:phosphatidylserine/phosphatidylglycerophosphate/cardiolipin synthase-like enzyme